jgi:hypothetical protein
MGVSQDQAEARAEAEPDEACRVCGSRGAKAIFDLNKEMSEHMTQLFLSASEEMIDA